VGAKGICLAGPPRSGETSWPDSRDPVASGVKCGPHEDHVWFEDRWMVAPLCDE
jgi:hypothetical protein